MNEDKMRQAARDRLATAELATVLDTPIAAVATSDAESQRQSQRQPHTRLLIAAMLLLGLGVAAGVGWLRANDQRTTAQQPDEFDPLNPWYNKYLPRTGKAIAIRKLEDYDQASASDFDHVFLAGRDQAKLLAALPKQPAAQNVTIVFGQDGPLDTSAWQALGTTPHLKNLSLSGSYRLKPDRLRELRHAPQLRSIMIGNAQNAFDEACAAALVELPHLRAVTFANTRVTAAGIRALTGLPHLNTLVFLQTPLDDELLAAIGELPQLRALCCNACFGASPLTTNALQQLGKLPELRVLNLAACNLNDDLLRALPARLESLTLARMDGASIEGARSLARLRKLRSLSFLGELPPQVQDEVAEQLQALPLENFEYFSGEPTTAMWRTLQGQPKLRGLTLNTLQGITPTPIAACKHLERLTLASREPTEPQTLARLADHPTLREFRLLEVPLRNQPDYREKHQQRLASLRRILGAKIRLLLD